MYWNSLHFDGIKSHRMRPEVKIRLCIKFSQAALCRVTNQHRNAMNLLQGIVTNRIADCQNRWMNDWWPFVTVIATDDERDVITIDLLECCRHSIVVVTIGAGWMTGSHAGRLFHIRRSRGGHRWMLSRWSRLENVHRTHRRWIKLIVQERRWRRQLVNARVPVRNRWRGRCWPRRPRGEPVTWFEWSVYFQDRWMLPGQRDKGHGSTKSPQAIANWQGERCETLEFRGDE